MGLDPATAHFGERQRSMVESGEAGTARRALSFESALARRRACMPMTDLLIRFFNFSLIGSWPSRVGFFEVVLFPSFLLLTFAGY